jgi:hypothetical protein
MAWTHSSAPVAAHGGEKQERQSGVARGMRHGANQCLSSVVERSALAVAVVRIKLGNLDQEMRKVGRIS